MKHVIFYSWQSDAKAAINRTFIENALEAAKKNIHLDDSVEVELSIDRDTQGVGGSPDIAATIFAKIDSADIFVCDVSLIGKTDKRSIPNPNVLLELGYAIKSKGWDNIILVLNMASGSIQELPFDLRTRRVVPYEAHPDEADRSAEKKKLAGQLEGLLRAMFGKLEKTKDAALATHTVDLVKEQIQEDKRIALQALVHGVIEESVGLLQDDKFALSEDATTESLLRRIRNYEEVMLQPLKVVATGCYFDSKPEIWIEAIDRIANAYEGKHEGTGARWWFDLRLYPALLTFHTAGIAATAANNYSLLVEILNRSVYYEYGSNKRRLCEYLEMWKAEHGDLWNARVLPGKAATPVSDHIWKFLRQCFASIIPMQKRYDEAFDKFEYLYGLHISATHKKASGQTWGPIGSFAWRRKGSNSVTEELKKEVSANVACPLAQSQIVPGDGYQFLKKLKEYSDFVDICKSGLGI